MEEKSRKLYYSIKEVAQEIGVSESLLRYWETEFPHLRPKTTGNRVRQYTEKDIEQIKVIYNLVKVRGFKIAAARKMLQENRSGADKSQKVMESLISVRDQLKELKGIIDSLV
ncbi:MerR family transcriptional regulator [Prevotella ihumii]|uniref:MerR family transcriptional regulator n=1 Tax=Prevotella ihumii TaxID=1917878 RepID=UPI000981F890|nr:MerR family transcriptional regulator [Prevotella ihumii]